MKIINIEDIKLFLNTLNLTIREETDSDIDIINNNQEKVGSIYSKDNLLVFNANINDYNLNGFLESAKNNDSQIEFKINNSNDYINGHIHINHLGNKRSIHSSLTSNNSDNDYTNIKILKEGNIFYIIQKKNNNTEEIAVKPFLGSIYHSITKGEYDIGKECFPYHYYAGIFDDGKSPFISTFLREEEEHDMLDYQNEKIKRVAKKDSELDLIQKGFLMQEIDPTMADRIQELIELFTIDDINLIDELFAISYRNYSDNELLALLGINDRCKKRGKQKIK